MQINNNILNDLNIVLNGEFETKYLMLPFLFKASDISSYAINLIDETYELKGESKYENNVKFIKEKLLRYIDIYKIELDIETIKELDMNLKIFNYNEYKEIYTLKDIDGLYLLFTKLGMDDHDYFNIGNYVQSRLLEIRDEIITIVHLGMENGRKDENLSEEFMMIQTIMEFSSALLFHENQNKAGDQWSYREILLRRAYTSRKFESEKYMRERLKNESNRGQ